jgi:hypothetical protein
MTGSWQEDLRTQLKRYDNCVALLNEEHYRSAGIISHNIAFDIKKITLVQNKTIGIGVLLDSIPLFH